MSKLELFKKLKTTCWILTIVFMFIASYVSMWLFLFSIIFSGLYIYCLIVVWKLKKKQKKKS